MKLRSIGITFSLAFAVAAGAQDDPATKVQVDGQEVHFKGMQPRIGRRSTPSSDARRLRENGWVRRI